MAETESVEDQARENPPEPDPVQPAGFSGSKKFSLFTILTVLFLSVAGRFAFAESVQRSAVVPGSALGLVDPGASRAGAEATPGESGGIAAFLPVFTEGSFFALIGFALGYTSRKIVKLALIFLAVFFAGLQGLTYAGVTVVDWVRLVEVVNDAILNLKENQTIMEVLTNRVPTVGGFAGGYFLGFRRG